MVPGNPTLMKWQKPLLMVFVAGIAAVLGWWLGGRQLMTILEYKSYDLRCLLRGTLPAKVAPPLRPAPVTVVMIDAKTDDYLQKPKVKPRMFWPADYGEVITAAVTGGAKVIGLDWYFSYPIAQWDPEADGKFFSAYMEAAGQGVPVVLAYERVEKERDTEAWVPVYYQAVAEGNIGYANITQDDDTFVRKLELFSKEGYLALSARMAAALLKIPPPSFQGGTLQLGTRVIPKVGSEAGRPIMYIQFYGPRRQVFPTLSMADVLKAKRAGNQEQLKQWFDGRAVLIGPDDLLDRHPTPFALATRVEGGERTEGVEIHAHALSTLVNGDFIRLATTQEAWALILAAALAAAVSGFKLRWPWGPLAAVGILLLVFLVTLVALARGVHLPLVRTELAAILGSVGAYGARLLTEDRKRRLLEHTFSSFVSREVLGTILDAGGVPLGGTRIEVTVLFSDIRNFTTYCENRDPQSVVEELNAYFGEMAASIIQQGGMVNKYIGDGIMALFGAPIANPDHARRAVLCARDMITRLAALNARRQAVHLEPLCIGVGIHTGEVVVGNIGARDSKMEYTAVGDTVNVASRIEGMNKEFGTQVLLSLSTREHMGVDILTRFKGYHTVKGRNEPLAVYTIE